MDLITNDNFNKKVKKEDGIYRLKAIEFVKIVDSKKIYMSEVQRTCRVKKSDIGKIYKQVAECSNMPFGTVIVCYNTQQRRFELVDGQQRYNKFKNLFEEGHPCGRGVSFNHTVLKPSLAYGDDKFPQDFKNALDNIEINMDVRVCDTPDQLKYIITEINNNHERWSQGDNENAERYDDIEWKRAGIRAEDHKNFLKNERYICSRLLTTINEDIEDANLDILKFESWFDNTVPHIYEKIFPEKKASNADHNYTAVANFCKRVYLNDKTLLLVDSTTIDSLKAFFDGLNKLKSGDGSNIDSNILDYWNIRALNDTDSWSDRGDCIYKYIKAHNPLF